MDEIELSSQQFSRTGVLGPFPRLAALTLVKEVRALAYEIVSEQQISPIYGQYALRDWHLHHEQFRRLLTSPEIIHTLSLLTGAESLILWRSKIFEKYPGDGSIDWHQEWGYFDGEEIGGSTPALAPKDSTHAWNWTVWVGLTDVTSDDGVMEFIVGSNHRQFPKSMVPLLESGAYVDPAPRCRDRDEVLRRANTNSLVLDIDTSSVFAGVNTENLSKEQLLEIVRDYCSSLEAVVTDPFSEPIEHHVTVPLVAGQYIVFSERTMHRSRSAAINRPIRLALNARYTLGSTTVYPDRNVGNMHDGSGLDISSHSCVPVLGNEFNAGNVYFESST